jgi:hypothetical protein
MISHFTWINSSNLHTLIPVITSVINKDNCDKRHNDIKVTSKVLMVSNGHNQLHFLKYNAYGHFLHVKTHYKYNEWVSFNLC